MRKQTCLCMLTFMLVLVGMATCSLDPIPFNVTVGYQFTWKTESFTNIAYTFLTEKTSGLGVYTDLSDSKEFSSYSVPTGLNGYNMYGVFQVDMQKVILPPSGGATFSFTHDFSFGILNVNPKQLCIVGVDVDSKKFVQVDFVSGSAPFTQQVVLPLQTKVYTLGVMGVAKEIPARFGVPTLVNYRASLKYELHKDLNQYLSAFVNRQLSYPAYEYTAKLVDNRLALPSNQMVEIASFSFNPMFKPSYNARMVIDDFMFSFDLSKGFVDKNGKKIEIDFMSLQCLYVIDENQGFAQTYGSVVFPDLQELTCTAGVGGIGANNFFPKYVTIVANVGSTPPNPPQPINSPKPPQPINSPSPPQPIPSPKPSPVASPQPKPVNSPSPVASPKPVYSPKPIPSPKPVYSPKPIYSPKPVPSPKPVNSQSPPQPITSKSTTPTYSINAKKSHFPRNGAFSVKRMTLELVVVVMMVACLLL